MDLYTCYL